MASVLVKAEATETRTYLNLHDLRLAFEDEQTRPRAAAGPIQASYELLVHDWTEDSGEEGDKYDPELAALFRRASEGVELDPVLMQEFLDRLKAKDPAVANVLIDDPAGIDSLLVQFPAYTGDPDSTKALQKDSKRAGLARTGVSRPLPGASSRSQSQTKSPAVRRRQSVRPSRWRSASSPSSSG